MYKIEELEKMLKEAYEKNDYELYKKACCLLYLYIKLCSESEEDRACSVLFDALRNEKSEGFLCVAREINDGDKGSSYADNVVYALLLSVRVHSHIVVDFLLNICDEIQDKVLRMMVEEEKSEKRE